VRLPRVVASAVLIASLASVVVPGPAGSRAQSTPGAFDPSAFKRLDGLVQTTVTIPLLDPGLRSAGSLEIDPILRDPLALTDSGAEPRPTSDVPLAESIARPKWVLDSNISWYGPGFYGRNGACGMFGADGLQPDDVGVAHRTLPCGTKVTFRYLGYTVTTRVVDRGPYVAGRTWDMTKGLCTLLHHCFTGGGVYWHLG